TGDTPASDRLTAVRTMTYMYARDFLKRQEE
ncbi:MAG: hypothetical protein HW418_933, partial [Anaerolineales bacterium]|nr:hypothetical protein [Anaerolineales bacterium]